MAWRTTGVVATVLTATLALTDPLGAGRPDGGSAGPPPATSAGLVPVASQPCTDVLMVAVPGNAEAPVAGVAGSAGPTLDVFAETYRAAADAGRRSVETRVIAPATAEARRLGAPGAGGRAAVRAVTRAKLREWRGRVGVTAREVLGVVEAAAVRCPQQQLVLAGYSQGAMAMHRALVTLEQRPAVADRIAATVLVGDGYRPPGTRARALVGEPRAPRSGQGVATLFNTPPADLPGVGSPVRVWQVCVRGDVVCDIRSTSLRDAVAAHRSYTSVSSVKLAAVGQRAFTRTSRWPLPDPVTTTVEADQGKPLEVQLGVRVRAADLSAVRWRAVGTVPSGVTLDEHGLLSGVPTVAGDFRVAYEVRSTVAPELGRPASGELTVQVAAAAEPTGAVVSAGGTQSCEVRADGTAWCWGDDGYGQLGNGTAPSSRKPVQVGTRQGWTSVSTSGSTTCGTRTAGTAHCWGLNRWGQLGDGSRSTRRRPARVAGDGPWASVVPGWFHTCGIKQDASLWCWGSNVSGQLGDGTTTIRTVPTQVAGGGAWSSVTVGGWHTCAVKLDGSAWCWGRNLLGELGVSGNFIRKQPQRLGTAADWASLEASWSHTCGLKKTGTVLCWGKNDRGQLGDGTRRGHAAPAPVKSDQRFVDLSLGDTHSCALTDTGRLWCWGHNRYGQHGDGTQVASRAPVAAAGDTRWEAFDAGWMHSCGVRLGGGTRCWGANEHGQVGDGTLADRRVPVPTGGGS